MSKIIIGSVIALSGAIVFGAIVLSMKLWTGQSFQTIWSGHRKLIPLALVIAVGLLAMAALALVIHNN